VLTLPTRCGFLLNAAGFAGAAWITAATLALVSLGSWLVLPPDMGRAKNKTAFAFALIAALIALALPRAALHPARLAALGEIKIEGD
jgi:hypothetical protein